MKNKLFVISILIVFSLLISINYNSINDYYVYSVPLNSLVFGPSFYEDNTEQFQKIYNDKDSECYTTLYGNLFCYSKPKMAGEQIMASYVVGKNGIDGELHFDPVDDGVYYFLMLNITQISGDKALITFADKDYQIGADDHRLMIDDFEFSTTIEKFDTFISHCNTVEGNSVTIVQYLGITTIDGIDYFMTWHMPADSKQGITCDYPQIIKHSLEHDFREL